MSFIKDFYVSSRISGLPYVIALYTPFCYLYDVTFVDIIYCILTVNGFISGMLTNNFFDYFADIEHNPEKIGLKHTYLKYAMIFFLSTQVCGIRYLDSIDDSSILTCGASISLILSTFYTPIFKKIPLVKNLITSIYMSFIPIFSLVYYKTDYETALTLSLPTSFFVVIREVLLDINDVIEDTDNNVRTIPVLFGENNTIRLLKFAVRAFWIASMYFYNDSPISCGLLSVMCSFSYCRMYFIENREFVYGILNFHILYPILMYDFNIYKATLTFAWMIVVNFVINHESYDEIWKVFCRKMFHILTGCMLLELEQSIVLLILTVTLLSNIVFPNIYFGFEKGYTDILLDDIGIRFWCVILFVYSLLSNEENYYKLLPFFICDPTGAIVGRNTPLREKIIIWANQKSLQGSSMVFATSVALTGSFFLSFLITFGELFGGDYDNGIIGLILIASYPFRLGLERLPSL